MNSNFSWSQIRSNFLIYEDKAILAINKPSGLSVTGDRNKNDITTLATASGENIIPAHRIDKETSGLVLFAKDLHTHSKLTRQFAKRSIEKYYLAIIKNPNLQHMALIDLPLSIGRKNKVRIAANREDIFFNTDNNTWSVPSNKIFTHVKNYPSLTKFITISKDNLSSILLVQPISGRRHQIRVHLAWVNSPIEGDPLFTKKNDVKLSRTFLHSWQIKFTASWLNNSKLTLEAPPQADFWINIDQRESKELEIITSNILLDKARILSQSLSKII